MLFRYYTLLNASLRSIHGLSQAEQKLENSKAEYEKLNRELIEQLQRFYSNRFDDFEPIYRSLLINQVDLLVFLF